MNHTSGALTAAVPKKQVRASRPKVRTGCRTCKRRRIKCDQQKPHCNRCVKAKVECEGYGIFIPFHSSTCLQSQHKLPIPPTASHGFIFYRGLNSLSQLTEFESASYDFARQCTVADLSTLQCVHFWTNSVLAGCHSDPAILHAILALGAAHRSHSLNLPNEPMASTKSFSQVAYTHYGKAIKHLQTRLTSDDADNCRIILVVCLILLVFDLLQERGPGAMMHLHHGRRILKMLYSPKSPKALSFTQDLLYLPPNTQSINEELIYQFGQMDLQSTNFGSGRPQFCLVDDPDASDPFSYLVPEKFVSIDDAGRYILIMMNDCWRLVGMEADTKKLNSSNVEAVAHRHRLLTSLRRWEQAFEASEIKSSVMSLSIDPDARKAITLQIHHALITIKVTVCLSYPDEMVYDSLLPFQSRIVSLADALLPHMSTFSLDVAIVQPLYHTAVHCRHPVVRRQAVDLLHRAGKEGLWDSSMLEILGRQVIKCEEEDALFRYDDQALRLADLDLANIVPAKSRIAGTLAIYADEEQTALRLTHKRPKWKDDPITGIRASFVDNEDSWELIEQLVPWVKKG